MEKHVEVYKPSGKEFALNRPYIIQRKYDGNRIFGTIDEDDVNIYSHRTSKTTGNKINYNNKFPHLIMELENLNLPINTMLDGELILRQDYLEDFKTLSAISRSNNAYDRQKNEVEKMCEWIVFDIHYFEDQYLERLSYKDKMEVLAQIIKDTSYIHLPEQIDMEPRKAFEYAVSKGWEGIVLRDSDCHTGLIIGDGNAPRPHGCYKWKPICEADVLVDGFKYGNGKYKDMVGSLKCFVKNKDKLVEFCNCSGMTDPQREELLYTDYPFVASLEFDGITEHGKALKPRLLKIHEDKSSIQEILDLSDSNLFQNIIKAN